MRWQVLIPHMPHRHDALVRLLECLAAQWDPAMQVVVFTDNLQLPYREKLQVLYDQATADYVSSLGNDDLVAPDFVPRILGALDGDPDYVGFRVRYTEGGVPQLPVVHSMQEGGWWTDAAGHHRDFMYYNPIRREIAQAIPFRGDYCDEEWAEDVRASRLVETEVFIDDELLYYQRDPGDNFHTDRRPLPREEIPPLPCYPFVKHLVFEEDDEFTRVVAR